MSILLAMTVFIPALFQTTVGIKKIGTCIPNSKFSWSNKICTCDRLGVFSDANCILYPPYRRQTCRPGQITWIGCRQCICQENGQLNCNNVKCKGNFSRTLTSFKQGFTAMGPWCTPFRSYYVNCSLCVCPATGLTTDAGCTIDSSCSKELKSTLPSNLTNTSCLPKVTYLFNCLHCLCSDEGHFDIEQCVETCDGPKGRKCTPGSFYRNQCNVCYCSDDSNDPDNKYCTKSSCSQDLSFSSLKHLRSKSSACTSHTFAPTRCIYCECGANGKADEESCLELKCLKTKDNQYGMVRQECESGEIVPICYECFCMSNNTTTDSYCLPECSDRSKLQILENVLINVESNTALFDQNMSRDTITKKCIPSTIHPYGGRYCICTANGTIDFKLCTVDVKINKKKHQFDKQVISTEYNLKGIDLNATCEPSTFVEFQCNTCFCSKQGTIDPKWCTYDDCDVKIMIQRNQKSSIVEKMKKDRGTCTSGAISKVDCNFCICPHSGLVSELSCTSNLCSGFDQRFAKENFICEPFTYYEVDCNICYCPQDGIKNVAKCTKNICEKNFLRSDVCVPGHLFSDECNVCVCPPNGDRTDKACTNHTCVDTASAWRKIFKLPQLPFSNEINDDSTRTLDVCFGGEEFTVGCNLCTCPDIGLRGYSTCTPALCVDDDHGDVEDKDKVPPTMSLRANIRSMSSRRCENCVVAETVLKIPEEQTCIPGSIYVKGCNECICPYIGDGNYCRPLTLNSRCQATINKFNYTKIGRTNAQDNSENSHDNVTNNLRHQCRSPGNIMDECYICECQIINGEENLLIENNCFRSDADRCSSKRPSFLRDGFVM